MLKFCKLILHLFKRYVLPRGFTRMNWKDTYNFTTKFLNLNKHLKVGLEIGVAGGNHIHSILEKTNVEKMYGVDPYVNYGGIEEEPFKKDMVYLFKGKKEILNNSDKINEKFDELYQHTRKKLHIHGLKVELMRLTSVEAAKKFKDSELDFVFIDGAHDYKNCLIDIKTWYGKVRKNGFIMGHDYNSEMFPGVTIAVNEFFNERNLTVKIDHKSEVWYVQKLH